MAFDPITAIFDVAGKVLDRILPDKKANDAAKQALQQMQLSGELAQLTGQLEINKVEAASSSVFVAGWRPFIGWVCGCGLAIEFIIRPVSIILCRLFGHPVSIEPLDIRDLIAILSGMLGFGVMRSVEKFKGVDTKSVGGGA